MSKVDAVDNRCQYRAAGVHRPPTLVPAAAEVVELGAGTGTLAAGRHPAKAMQHLPNLPADLRLRSKPGEPLAPNPCDA